MPGEKPPDWELLVGQHAERVFRIAFRILGSVHDAEDVSQTVFIEAFRMRAVERVQSWTGLFVRLATVRAIDYWRKRHKTDRLIEEDTVSHVGPVEESTGAELAAWIRHAVSELPEQQAAVFSLTFFEHMNRNEVAAALDVSPETVSTSLYKSRQRLLSQIKVFNGEKE